MKTTVSSRARSHEDRGGDPLDGLVNLFDLGIVLAVAFLIAALSSVDMTDVLTDREAARERVSADAIVIDPNEQANTIDLEPGQQVVGSGEQIGRVYRLADGRLVIVRGGQGGDAAAEVGSQQERNQTP